MVHGYIDAWEDYFEENAAIIASLPEEDTWPYLTRDLFAVPQQKHSYNGQIISFGTMYSGVEGDWEQWLSKFDSVLRRMYWDDAHVYLQSEVWGAYHYVWGAYHYVWEIIIPPEAAEEGLQLPLQEWKFSGGPRSGLRAAYKPEVPNS
jgi:hypothetical protein